MIRFMTGLALLIFSSIVGFYQYMENTDTIALRQRMLSEKIEEQEQTADLQTRLANLKRTTFTQGEDQKFNIERLLGIGAPGLEFSFIGQPRGIGGSAQVLYRHTFRIQGPTEFLTTFQVLRKLAATPGFVVYRLCYACTNVPKDTPSNLRMALIEGYLYVYDPKALQL